MRDQDLRIEETVLPGVGARFSFTLADGRRVSVVVRHSGRREVFLGSAADPDTSVLLLTLGTEESRTLAELLGGSQVVRDLAEIEQDVEGVTLEWITVGSDSPASGRSIGQLRLRSTTGATVVGVVRSGQTSPTPGPDQVLEGGDVLAVVGTPDSMARVRDLFRDD